MKLTRKLIYWILYWILLSGLIKQFVWTSPYIDMFTDSLVIITGYRVWKMKSDEVVSRYVGKVIPCLIVAFLVVGSIAAFINFVPLPTWVWGIRMYVRYYLLFMAMFKAFQPEDLQNFKYIFKKFLVYNLVFIIYETLVMNMRGDSVGGLFSGGNASFVNFMIPSMFLVISDYYQNRVSDKVLLQTVAGIFYFAILGESKFVYFVLPVMIYGSYVLQKRFSLGHIVTLLVAFFALIPLMQYFISMYHGEKYAERIFTTEYIKTETSANGFGGDFNRSVQIEMAQLYFMNTAVDATIGHGIGVGSTSDLFTSDFSRQYRYTVFQYFSASYLLAETGWSGFIIYVVAHIILLLKFWKFYRNYFNDNEIKYWSSCGILSTSITFLMMWYNNYPVYNYYLMYVFWAMCFLGIKFRIKEIAFSGKV